MSSFQRLPITFHRREEDSFFFFFFSFSSMRELVIALAVIHLENMKAPPIAT